MSCTPVVKTVSGICHGKDGLDQCRALSLPDHQLCLGNALHALGWHQDTCLVSQPGISWGKGSLVQPPILSEMSQSEATLLV